MYINKINIIPIIIVTFESIDIIKQNYFSWITKVTLFSGRFVTARGQGISFQRDQWVHVQYEMIIVVI